MPIVTLAYKNAKLANLLEQNVLLLACVLPISVPFGLSRSIGLQALLVTLTGGLAWLAVFLRQPKLDRITQCLLGLYVALCALSLIGNMNIANLFGSPLMRLGSLELIAVVGIGLALRSQPRGTVLISLYASICALAVISLPYTLLHTHHWVRIGGLLFQPDFLAVLVAVGLLFGGSLWLSTPRWRWPLALTQVYLTALLFLTQTRAVIAILFVLLLLVVALSKLPVMRKIGLAVVLITIVIGGTLATRPLLGGRLGNAQFAGQSISYRLELQAVGGRQLTRRPLQGYGAAGLRTPLSCRHVAAPALVHTCHQGYYFDSSHNIFLDRFLQLGWLGGASFAALIIWLLRRARCNSGSLPFLLSSLLIVLYYLTNVTCIAIELLLWICLLQAAEFDSKKLDNSKHKRI